MRSSASQNLLQQKTGEMPESISFFYAKESALCAQRAWLLKK